MSNVPDGGVWPDCASPLIVGVEGGLPYGQMDCCAQVVEGVCPLHGAAAPPIRASISRRPHEGDQWCDLFAGHPLALLREEHYPKHRWAKTLLWLVERFDS